MQWNTSDIHTDTIPMKIHINRIMLADACAQKCLQTHRPTSSDLNLNSEVWVHYESEKAFHFSLSCCGSSYCMFSVYMWVFTVFSLHSPLACAHVHTHTYKYTLKPTYSEKNCVCLELHKYFYTHTQLSSKISQTESACMFLLLLFLNFNHTQRQCSHKCHNRYFELNGYWVNLHLLRPRRVWTICNVVTHLSFPW